MNKKHPLVVLLAILLVASSVAQTSHAPAKTLAVSLTSFQKLFINTPVELVLVQDDASKQAIIEGDENLVAAMVLFIAKDVMTVSGKEPAGNEKVKLTIPVDKLTWLQINADAQIVAQNVLASSQLTVFVNANCAVNLKSAGKILVTGVEGHEIIYTKR